MRDQIAGLRLETNRHLPYGTMALLNGREVIWVGAIGAPIEDVLLDFRLCDGMMLNPADVCKLKERERAREARAVSDGKRRPG